jgi:predicted permease
MASSFTLPKLAEHGTNLLFSCLLMLIVLIIGISLAPLFVKTKCYERGIYQYALVFANFGYMGDPLVQALFGDEVLGAYKLFCLPLNIATYVWGISVLTPGSDKGIAAALKRALNFPTLSMLAGMLVGITGTLGYIPAFAVNGLNALKACMGPVAMLLAGVIIAKYNFVSLLKIKKLYVATLLRLVILPVLILSVLSGIRWISNDIFALSLSTSPIYFAFFATALPLGMYTVVFPEAYGGDPEPGAGMAIISSAFSLISIPIFYTVLTELIACPFA